MTKAEQLETALNMLKPYRGQAAAIAGVLTEASRFCFLSGIGDTTVGGFGYLLDRIEHELAAAKARQVALDCCPDCKSEGRIPNESGNFGSRPCELCDGRGTVPAGQVEWRRESIEARKMLK